MVEQAFVRMYIKLERTHFLCTPLVTLSQNHYRIWKSRYLLITRLS